MSNYYPVGSSMAARINFDEFVRNYAHDTWALLDAESRQWAAGNWEEYFDIEMYDTDDEEELTFRFREVWRYEMTTEEELQEGNEYFDYGVLI